MIGRTLGPYQVVAKLGEGGMGEVYRARDTRLGRDVALKLLPGRPGANPSPAGSTDDRLMRFEREAQMLAALNHPHIAQIYGIEDFDGARAIVMECVEGATLDEIIFGAARPSGADVLAIFRQIAGALEAAHDAGIVHRDLKPSNVKLRPDGTVKVLDFGLAKALDPQAATASNPVGSPHPGTEHPTVTSPAMTALGVILGTAAYMAPEQARGRPVDRRADIWAFGVMLWEALTGQRGFHGETISDTIAAVLTRTLDLASLPADTPDRVRGLIARCLDKDPKQRLRDVGEARVVLEQPDLETARLTRPDSTPRRRLTPVTLGLALATALLGLAGGWWLASADPNGATDPPVAKSHVALQTNAAPIDGFALSPDGRAIVYAAAGTIWLQRLDQWQPRELVTFAGRTAAAWSPKSDAIAYVADGRLMRIGLDESAPRQVARLQAVPEGSISMAWRHDDVIFVTHHNGPLYQVSAAGGELAAAVEPPVAEDSQRGRTDFHLPAPLPGRSELLALLHRDLGLDAIVVVGEAGTTVVLDTPGVPMSRVAYSPTGHLVFGRSEDETLWAVRFSLSDLRAEGEPFSLGPGRLPAAGPDGTLYFLGGNEITSRRLTWVSRTGQETPTAVPPDFWNNGLAVAPDGQRAVAGNASGVWIYDLATGTRSRVTSGAGDTQPVWLPDGRIAFTRQEGGIESVFIAPATGTGPEVLVREQARYPTIAHRDTRLVFNLDAGPSRRAAWVDLADLRQVQELATHQGARFPAISPDGSLLLYVSRATGRDEIWVTRFPSGEGRWQVSFDGGGFAQWNPKGGELFFGARRNGGTRQLWSVRVEPGASPTFSAPVSLIGWGAAWDPWYAVAPDGERFLVSAAEDGDAAASIRVVRNWAREHAGR